MNSQKKYSKKVLFITFFRKIASSKIPVLLLLNKIDGSNQEELEIQSEFWQQKIPNAEFYPISALTGFNVKEVFNRIIELLPESPPFYPKDQLTDKPERFFVNETIREKILMHYKKETVAKCPHCISYNNNGRLNKRRKNHQNSICDYGGA